MSVILSGRFGFIVWEAQTDANGKLPESPAWKPVGIVRDVRVRAPAGTQILRSESSIQPSRCPSISQPVATLKCRFRKG